MMPTMDGERSRLQPAKRSLLFLATICAAVFFAFAQNTQTGSPVVLDGKTVITIHWGYGNYTPQARAHGIASRLKALAGDLTTSLDITQEADAFSTDIKCGDTIIASVFDGDARAEGTTRDALAEQWSASFLSAMQAYRAEHSWKRTAIRTGLALLIIGSCVLLLLLARRITNRMALTTSALLEQSIKSTSSRMARIVSSAQLRSIVMRAFLIVRIILWLVILAFASHILLGIFPSTRPLAIGIYEGVAGPARGFSHSVWVDLPSFIFIALLVLATWYLIKLIRYFFRKVAQGAITLEGFHPAWASVTERLISIAVVVFAILIAYPYIPGSQTAAFKGISLFLGVLFSLGSTGLVANIITGIMLTYMDAFEVGDLVQIGEVNAYVKKMSLLTTRFITRKNEIITMPNSTIMGKHIVNYSARGGKDSLLVSVTVGIRYDSPWRQVEALLLEAAARTESVLTDPAPFTLLLSLDDFNVKYEINAYVRAGVRRYLALTELNRNVLDVFNEYGISIMTPAYQEETTDLKLVKKENWYSPPAKPEQTPAPEQREYPPSRS
ncbi:MAG TPA: mechanosensitive ion channel family protein [Pseudacidobacterium sp.]|jgi:small-conductance mechanosensitive channel|nr:mechanosensitive ion channel family protein [Pseudacidobacterium sp.]